jgi:predicted RNase H-like HicB family nuclease
MDTYDVELEAAEPDGFAVTVPAFPGLLILGATLDEALARARASIAFRVRVPENGLLTDRIAVVPRIYTGPRRRAASASQPLRDVGSGESAA